MFSPCRNDNEVQQEHVCSDEEQYKLQQYLMPKLTNNKVEGTDKINISIVPQDQLALKPKKEEKKKPKYQQKHNLCQQYETNKQLK